MPNEVQFIVISLPDIYSTNIPKWYILFSNELYEIIVGWFPLTLISLK